MAPMSSLQLRFKNSAFLKDLMISLLFIGIFLINIPGKFRYPFSPSIYFLIIQTFVFILFLMMKRKNSRLAYALIFTDIYALILTSKIIYFTKPFIVKSELLMNRKPTIFFYWIFIFFAAFLALYIYLLSRLRQKNLFIIILISIFFTFFYNYRYLYQGKERIKISENKIYIENAKLAKTEGPPVYRRNYHLSRYVKKARNRKKALVLFLKKGMLNIPKTFWILKSKNLKIKKNKFSLEINGQKFYIFFPWFLLEILILPFSFLLFFLFKRIRMKFAIILSVLFLGVLFYLQGSFYYKTQREGFLNLDTTEYIIKAESMLRGFSFGEELGFGGQGPCYWPPLTTYLNAAFLWFFGRKWSIYILIKTLMFIIELLVLKKIADDFGIPPLPLLLIFGLSGYMIYLASTESDSTFAFFFLLSFYFFLGKKTIGKILSGLFLGVATLSRSLTLFLSIFWGALAKRKKMIIVFFAAFLLTISPWIFRCYKKEGRLVPISTGGPHGFFSGNSPFSTGGIMLNYPTAARKFRKMGYNPNSISDIAKYNLKHPKNIVRLLPNKLIWLLWKDPKNYEKYIPGIRWSVFYGFSFLRMKYNTPFSEGFKLFIYLFALVGIFQFLKTKKGKEIFLLTTFLYFFGIYMAALGLPRYSSSFIFLIYILTLRGFIDA